MEDKTIVRIAFGSFVKLCALIGLPFGFLFGIFTLGCALLRGTATSNLFVVKLSGLTAGLVNLVWGPILFAFLFSVIAVIAYFPFTLILNMCGGVRMKVLS